MKHSRVVALLFGVGSIAAAGCTDLSPLRDRKWDEVTVEQLEVAATSDEPAVLQGVEGLLAARLDGSAAVDLESALEALTCLRATQNPSAFDVVARSAREDEREEVRWLALDTLVAIDPAKAQPILADLETSDESALVREHAAELATP